MSGRIGNEARPFKRCQTPCTKYCNINELQRPKRHNRPQPQASFIGCVPIAEARRCRESPQSLSACQSLCDGRNSPLVSPVRDRAETSAVTSFACEARRCSNIDEPVHEVGAAPPDWQAPKSSRDRSTTGPEGSTG
jgi:hypothetical protein